MNPIRAFFKWLDSHFTARPWPERRPDQSDPYWDNLSREMRLKTERRALQAKRDRARRNKKKFSHIERALQENTAALLKLEGER